MDSTTLLSIFIPVTAVGVMIFILFKFKKYEPLTYTEYFMKDQDGPYLHILGARRIMPDQGDSFDIFEHYVLDYEQLKFTKGGSQRGKNLELGSEFVKRSLAQLSQKLNHAFVFVKRKEGFDEEKDGFIKVYRFDEVQSDTEEFDQMSPNSLVFINRGDEANHFSVILYRDGRELARHGMRGLSDYFFTTIYLEDKSWLCFLYRKQRLARSGMAVCILNYDTGALIFDGFVQPAKA